MVVEEKEVWAWNRLISIQKARVFLTKADQ